MRQKMKRMMGILLGLALMLGLIPGMSLTVYAATDVYTSLIPIDKENETARAARQVTFNGYKWYIIGDNSTSATEGTVTLLAADTKFGTSAFETYGQSNSYNISTVKRYLDNAIRELKSLGIGVDFQKENIFTLDSKGEFLITIMSSLSKVHLRERPVGDKETDVGRKVQRHLLPLHWLRPGC